MVRVKAEEAWKVAETLKARLEPGCDRIEIAGSLRRHQPEIGDIEVLAVPKYRGKVNLLDGAVMDLIFDGVLDYRRNKRGSRMYGPYNKFLIHIASGIDIDIFTTTEECWPMALVIRTGPKESNIAIATAAQRKGWRLKPYGSGFDTPDGPVRCHSEREVFEKVGLPYLPPEQR